MPRSLFLSCYLARSAALFRKGPWRQEKGGRKREEGKHSVFVIKRCFHWGMCALAVDCFLLAAYLQGFWLRAWLELFFPKEREKVSGLMRKRPCRAWGINHCCHRNPEIHDTGSPVYDVATPLADQAELVPSPQEDWKQDRKREGECQHAFVTFHILLSEGKMVV